MINKQLFFAPHPALRHVANNIMIGHIITDDLKTNLSFPFPPLPEHTIIFYPYDKPVSEDVNTKKIYKLHACTIAGQLTERHTLSPGRNHLMIKIGFQPGALQRLLGEPIYKCFLTKTMTVKSYSEAMSAVGQEVGYDGRVVAFYAWFLLARIGFHSSVGLAIQ